MKNQDEQYIIQLIREGKANKEIADVFGITENAMKNRVHRMLRKYQCKNRVELAFKTVDVPRGTT